MTAKRWTLILLVALLIIAAATAVVFAGRQASANASPAAINDLTPDDTAAQQAAAGKYVYAYSVKFVCGYQPPLTNEPSGFPPGEPVVKAGNYATDINIHNYSFRPAELRKKLVVLVETSFDGKEQDVWREPRTRGPVTNPDGTLKYEAIKLEADHATLDDCFALWTMSTPLTVLPPTPMPLMVGYLVIYSNLDLDVDAVYTAAAPGLAGTAPQSLSIDVERVPGKRVFLPATDMP